MLRIRFPSEEVKIYHGDFLQIKQLIAGEKKVPAGNLIFVQEKQIFEGDEQIEKNDQTLDLMILCPDHLVICSKRLEELAIGMGVTPLIPPESKVALRHERQIKYTPRFYNINHIYYKNDNLKVRARDWASQFLDPYEEHKIRRLDRIETLCTKLQSNQFVVSTFNKPYIILFENFIASCERHNIDIRKKAIMFPMDEESYEACKRLNVTAYYEKGAYGKTTSNHNVYGDQYFRICMFMKNAIIQDMLSLGHDFLFQDIDMVWLKDPMDYLSGMANIQLYDFLFMFDGGNPRFQPLYYNSGFFYVKNTPFSKRAWQVIFNNFDVIHVYGSQQVLVNIVLSTFKERGLRSYLLDETLFLNGHRISPDGKNKSKVKDDTYVVHVSWTGNLEFKLKKLKENSLWYLN